MIVAGFGFRTGATPESLRDALGRAGGQADRVATLADKAASEAFRAFAASYHVTKVKPEALRDVRTATHSTQSRTVRQTGSVAEACALAAAGPNARLLAPRVISHDRLATCALAQVTPAGDDT
nr:cobalamin biosynthesis protein [Sediminimonas qiaohouensis]